MIEQDIQNAANQEAIDAILKVWNDPKTDEIDLMDVVVDSLREAGYKLI